MIVVLSSQRVGGSTRFPGKSLHLLAGCPLVQHVWERCLRARLVTRVLIATDDRRIKNAAEAFGAEVVMTSKRHQSGTDRIAEVAAHLEKKEWLQPTTSMFKEMSRSLMHA